MSLTAVRRTYSMYGVRVTTDIPFTFGDSVERDGCRLAEVSVVDGNRHDFAPWADARTAGDTLFFDEAVDGSCYLRWPHLYEFVVARDGSRIACRPLGGTDVSVLQNFLFGQVLAVALVRQGLEPLHAATIAIDDAAVAFLGDCTYGKSTLLASLMDAGYRVVTDDMLILEQRAAEFRARPGAGRVKLRPDSGRLFFGDRAGIQLTPSTQKRSFELDGSKQQRASVPLRLLYVLPAPAVRDNTRSIEIRPMSRAAAVRALVANTFTIHIVSRQRLARQFELATTMASSLNAFELGYPTGLDHLPAIRHAIVQHARHYLAEQTSMTESL